jgi:hypothetical protein
MQSLRPRSRNHHVAVLSGHIVSGSKLVKGGVKL